MLPSRYEPGSPADDRPEPDEHPYDADDAAEDAEQARREAKDDAIYERERERRAGI